MSRMVQAWLGMLLSVSALACAPAMLPQRFQTAVRAIEAHDAAADWNAQACDGLARKLGAIAELGLAAPAHYHTGLVQQRCGHHAQARAEFQAAVDQDPSMAIAAAQTALYDVELHPGPPWIDRALLALQRAVDQTRGQDPDVLSDLARMLQLRAGLNHDYGVGSDASRAHDALQRALWLRPGHLQARNQLALYHLAQARSGASAAGTRQSLALARMTCEPSVLGHSRYAPIHNTAGLVELQAGELGAAADAFDRARQLDPASFEAQMNYGAANLAFREAGRAQDGFRRAAELRPDSYDAWLGLAAALKAQARAEDLEAKAEEIERCLSRCVTLSPDRPEAWFNKALVMHERARGLTEPKLTLARLKSASELLSIFLSKAGASGRYAAQVLRAKELLKDEAEFSSFLHEAQKYR